MTASSGRSRTRYPWSLLYRKHRCFAGFPFMRSGKQGLLGKVSGPQRLLERRQQSVQSQLARSRSTAKRRVSIGELNMNVDALRGVPNTAVVAEVRTTRERSASPPRVRERRVSPRMSFGERRGLGAPDRPVGTWGSSMLTSSRSGGVAAKSSMPIVAAKKKLDAMTNQFKATDDDLRMLHALCASSALTVEYLRKSLEVKPDAPFTVLRGYYALHHLAANVCATGEMVELLVAANPSAVCAADELQRTPLHWYCSNRSVEERGVRAMVWAKAVVRRSADEMERTLDSAARVCAERLAAQEELLAGLSVRIVDAVCGDAAPSDIDALKEERADAVRALERLHAASPPSFVAKSVLTEEVWTGLAASIMRDGGFQLPIHAMCSNPLVSEGGGAVLKLLLFQDVLDERPGVALELKGLGLDDMQADFTAHVDIANYWKARSGDPQCAAVHHISAYDTMEAAPEIAPHDEMRCAALTEYAANVRSLATAQGGWGRLTPLHLLCANRHANASVLRRAVASGPSALTQMDSMGRLPIHHLCARVPAPDTETLAVLLAAQPTTGIVADLRGHTPLHLLVKSQCVARACRAEDPTLQRTWRVVREARRSGARVAPAAGNGVASSSGEGSAAKRLSDSIATFVHFCPQACMELTATGRTALHELCANINVYDASTASSSARPGGRKKAGGAVRRTSTMENLTKVAATLELMPVVIGNSSPHEGEGLGGAMRGSDNFEAMAAVISVAAMRAILRINPRAVEPDANGMTPVDILLENGAALYHSAGGLASFYDVFGVARLAHQRFLPRFLQNGLAFVRDVAVRRAEKQRVLAADGTSTVDDETSEQQWSVVEQIKRLAVASVRQVGNVDKVDVGLRRGDVRGVTFEESTAARLHSIWQETRRLPTDGSACETHQQRDARSLPRLEFEPRYKVVHGVRYDIANLGFWELPTHFRKGNIEQAKISCAGVRACWANPNGELDGAFVEAVAAELHAQWVADPGNRSSASVAQLRRYADLSDVEKEKDRVIARAAIDVWYDRGHRRRGATHNTLGLGQKASKSALSKQRRATFYRQRGARLGLVVNADAAPVAPWLSPGALSPVGVTNGIVPRSFSPTSLTPRGSRKREGSAYPLLH